MRLLSVDPKARPSAAQARDLLGAVAAGHGDSETTPIGGLPTGGTAKRARAPRLGPVAGSARRRPAPALLGLLLGVLVFGGGATIVALTIGSGAVAAAPPVSRTVAAALPASRTVAAAPTPMAAVPAATSRRRFPAPTSSPQPIPTSSPAPAAAPAPGTDPVAFVQRYYALLPSNTDAAFGLLGPRARSQAGGPVGFTSFYARMQSVSVQNPRLVGNATVDATVRFVQKDGTTSSEPYRFVMTTDGSQQMIMESFSRV